MSVRFLEHFNFVYDPEEVSFPFGQRYKPLSLPLQQGVCFFFPPLSPRDFRLRCLQLTESIDILLDSVGLTLLYQLKFRV
jgi:hypothetical protein